MPQRMAWILAGGLIAGILIFCAIRFATPSNVVAVCATPSARQLAADLVRAYAAHSRTPANRFALTDGSACDVRFSTDTHTRDAVIAHDGIVALVNPVNPIARLSTKQLRAIFSGSIRDWTQLGSPSGGAIIPVLPDASSDEANVITTSILFGVTVDPSVHRGGSSADVTRAVTGPDRASRNSIGLVAFSAAIVGKVVPLTQLPPPSVLSIASGRYPYWWTIAVESASSGDIAAAKGLVDYARSSDGMAIVQQDGLVRPVGL
jgi:phosphate transport system substrate-binding protein